MRRDEPGSTRARLPEGARDVLPIERSELTTLERGLREAFAAFGYREVRTPLLEFAESMDRAQDGGVGSAFRLFDERGRVIVLRPDLTIPVTRLVATRFAEHAGPVRVSYVGARLRPTRAGRAQPIEEQQAGAELVGLAGPAADAEILALLAGALRRLGVDDLRVAIGDVGLTRAVLDGLGVAGDDQARLQAAAKGRDLAGWRQVAEGLALAPKERELVAALPTRRGGVDVLDALAADVPPAASACAALVETMDLLTRYGAADAAMVDLGVLRDWGYYSGMVFEMYAPGLARPIAIGGRYDRLGARFGVDRPAVGGGVWLDGLHQAVLARARQEEVRDGVVFVGGLTSQVAAVRALRDAGLIVVALPDDADGEALAAAEGWRWVAHGSSRGAVVLDRTTGARVETSDIQEVFGSPSS